MANTARRGRPPVELNGGRSVTALYAQEVYEIIRALKGSENRPVRFREIWPRLASTTHHSNETNWKKLTTERCLSLLSKEGWIQRTIDGYLDLDSSAYPVYGLRRQLDKELDFAKELLTFTLFERFTQSEREDFRHSIVNWTTAVPLIVGFWLRALDERFAALAERANVDKGIVSAMRDPARRAADLARNMAHAYLMPEFEDALAAAGVSRKGWFKELSSDPRSLERYLRYGPEKPRRVKWRDLGDALKKLVPLETSLRKHLDDARTGFFSLRDAREEHWGRPP